MLKHQTEQPGLNLTLVGAMHPKFIKLKIFTIQVHRIQVDKKNQVITRMHTCNTIIFRSWSIILIASNILLR